VRETTCCMRGSAAWFCSSIPVVRLGRAAPRGPGWRWTYAAPHWTANRTLHLNSACWDLTGESGMRGGEREEGRGVGLLLFVFLFTFI
jgi:hypothetical protein